MKKKPGPVGDSETDIPPTPRGLKAAVYIMGILLIVGFIVVFSTIVYRTVNSGSEDQPRIRDTRDGYGTIESALPTGATIQETLLDGDRMTVRFIDGAETGIVIF
ncbi:MAG: hypothetical protein K8F25_06910, partial [Fimbriimonadaceae bacterium]|nr:hypothetical protein [Alphaproteobacteria bacterium]